MVVHESMVHSFLLVSSAPGHALLQDIDKPFPYWDIWVHSRCWFLQTAPANVLYRFLCEHKFPQLCGKCPEWNMLGLVEFMGLVLKKLSNCFHSGHPSTGLCVRAFWSCPNTIWCSWECEKHELLHLQSKAVWEKGPKCLPITWEEIPENSSCPHSSRRSP